jgi:two-component system, sensor histidine kinase PdtaS
MSRLEAPPTTDSGIRGIGRIPYGLHFCSFYSGKRDLVDLLVPFFKAGLENRERCLWITAPPFPASEALAEMEKVLPQVGEMIKRGSLLMLDAETWYGGISGGEVLQHWLEEEQKSLADGFQGLRLTGNTSFLKHEDWDSFMKYERSVNAAFLSRRIVALCSYDLRKSQASDVFEVTRSHQHTICRDESAHWEVVDRDHGPLSRLS